MNLYFIVLFENVEEDRGETINLLLDKKIISLEDLQNRLIELNNPEYIISTIKYVPNLINDKILDTITSFNNPKIIYKFLEIIDDDNFNKNYNNQEIINIKNKLNLLHRLEGLLVNNSYEKRIEVRDYDFLFSDIKIKRKTSE